MTWLQIESGSCFINFDSKFSDMILVTVHVDFIKNILPTNTQLPYGP